jgi:hypothetical protein
MLRTATKYRAMIAISTPESETRRDALCMRMAGSKGMVSDRVKS